MKLTDQQKQEKRQRDNLQHIINKLTSGFSFGTIKTWRDIYIQSGVDATVIEKEYTNASEAVTFPALKQYCDGLRAKLEESIKARNEAKAGAAEKIPVQEVKVIECGVIDRISAPPQLSTPTESSQSSEKDDDYGLVTSPNEKAYLYWFQKKATAELLSGFGITQ